MTIEAKTIAYLKEQFTVPSGQSGTSVPVSGDVPVPMPSKFITVEKTGGSRRNKVKYATLAVQSWAETRDEADKLNELVKTAMEGFVTQTDISRSALDSDYNFTDEETRRFRYQAVFDVVYLF